MAPMSQGDRIEKKLDKVLEEQGKIGRIVVAHGVKIKNLEEDNKRNKARFWTIAVMVFGGFISAIWMQVTGK